MNSTNHTILVVDDEETIRHNIEAFLEDEGFNVLTSDSGEKALELIESNIIHLAIIDIRLPGIDGNKLIERGLTKNKELKFLIHTGSSEYIIPSSLTSLGIKNEQVLFKPIIEMGNLTKAIRNILN